MPRRRRGLALLVLPILVLAGCDERSTAPDAAAPVVPDRIDPRAAAPDGGDALRAGTVILGPDEFRLVGSAEERRLGIYVLERLPEAVTRVEPGNVAIIVLAEDEGVLRRVHSVEETGGMLRLFTTSAYWPEIIAEGTYRRGISFDPDDDGGESMDGLVRLNAGGTVGNDTGTLPFDIDWCNAMEEVAADIEDPTVAAIVGDIQLCNRPDPVCQKFASTLVTVCGNPTQLRTFGDMRLAGSLGLTFTVDPGSVTVDPGRPPTFAPCADDPGAVGCFAPGNWVELAAGTLGLDPDLPEPASICIPVVTPGCSITDPGELPSVDIVLPSLTDVAFENGLLFDYDVTTTLGGEGSVEFELPVPGLSQNVLFLTPFPDLREVAQFKVGLFGVIGAEWSETVFHLSQGAAAAYDVDLGWDESSGWTGDASASASVSFGFEFERPDEVVLRGGLRPLILFRWKLLSARLPWALAGQLRAEANITAAFEDTFTEAPECPTTLPPAPAPICEAWKHDMDFVMETFDQAGIFLPLGLQVPGVPLVATFEHEFFRDDIVDVHGRGDLVATVSTSGEAIFDPYGLDPFPGYALGLGREAPAGSGADAPWAETTPLPLDAEGEPHVLEAVLDELDGSYRFSEHPDVEWSRDGLFGPDPVRCRQTYDFPTDELDEALDCTLLAGVGQFLTIGSVGINCTVGEATRIGSPGDVPSSFWRGVGLAPDETLEVPLAIACEPPVGDLDVSTATSGPDQDVDGYGIVLDGSSTGVVLPASARTTFEGLHVGPHQVVLEGVAFNCTVDPYEPEVLVGYRRTTATTVPVSCRDMIVVLCEIVDGIAGADGSARGIRRSLIQKCEAAIQSRSRGRVNAAENQLEAMLREVSAQRGRQVSEADADVLSASLTYILGSGLL